MTTELSTTDPRTGERRTTGILPTTSDGVDAAAIAARGAVRALAGRDRAWRASLLETIADVVDERREQLIATAKSETGLSTARLTAELTRTTFQFRLFAEAVRDGAFLEATIDHAAETVLGPQPDVRRMLVPLGPVAVFGSSNFPFAFSVPGGDTASALAAGNPVVAKAHSAHPLTSQVSAEAIAAAVQACAAPEGTFGIVYGQEAGLALVRHPAISAVGFTGSLGAAEHLMAAIGERERPIPFYGELQSVNPLVVTEAAIAARGSDIAAGLATSVAASAGQLCTKPGIAFIPAGRAGDAFAQQLADAVAAADPGVLLNERVAEGFHRAHDALTAAPGVHSLLAGEDGAQPGGFRVAARVLRVRATEVTQEHTIEAFGPLVLLVDYEDDGQLKDGLATVPDSLTTTLHIEPSDEPWAGELLAEIGESFGRLVINGFPTGVRVSWGQHHGGLWPATNSIHTSVGVTAMRRFLRLFAWQNAPQSLLPIELRDDEPGIPRRVDGRIVLPAADA